jgi:acyl-coenzyme A thioesterase PaaI-like protein
MALMNNEGPADLRLSPAEEAAQHHRRLAAMYAAAPVNAQVPSRVVVEDGRAEVFATVSPDFWHAAGAMHGALYFKGLDDAAFFAASSREPTCFVLTARFELDFFSPVTTSELRAVGRCDRISGRKIEASAELFVEGLVVARGRGLFVVSERRLLDVDAYRLG